MHVMQDLVWSNPPPILPNNDAYARLSPAEAVQAYFTASTHTNWDEMAKFDPAYDVQHDKDGFETGASIAAQMGVDARTLVPNMQAGEAFWSQEQNAWLVRCTANQTKKWNLAIRKDNPAGRWQVDGGL
jgi:hypothetical protein